jgi:hypothetical protein
VPRRGRVSFTRRAAHARRVVLCPRRTCVAAAVAAGRVCAPRRESRGRARACVRHRRAAACSRARIAMLAPPLSCVAPSHTPPFVSLTPSLVCSRSIINRRSAAAVRGASHATAAAAAARAAQRSAPRSCRRVDHRGGLRLLHTQNTHTHASAQHMAHMAGVSHPAAWAGAPLAG